MDDKSLPGDPRDDQENHQPEVRLELTQAGVRQVLSLYAEESAARDTGYQFSLDDLLTAIQQKWKQIAAWALLGCLLAGMVSFFATPLFSVTAQVVIEQQDPMEAAFGRSSGNSAFVATQAEILHSRSVIENAVANLAPSPATDVKAEDFNPVDDALEAVQASAISGTQVVALSYLGKDPIYGANLLTAIVDAYRHKFNADEIYMQQQRLQAKEDEYETLLKELEALESKLYTTRAEGFGGGSAEEAVAAQTQILRDQTERLGIVRQQRLALESQLLAGAVDISYDDPITRGLQEQLVQAEAELTRVSQTLKRGHPTVDAAQREVNLLRAQLTRSQQATPDALRKEIAASQALETQLQAVLAAEREKLLQAERSRRAEQLVMGELEQLHNLVDERRKALLDQRLLARMADAGEAGINARMIADPVQPEEPTWPNVPLILFIGLVTGSAIGLLLAVVSVIRRKERSWTGPRQFAN
jgi:protein tyrosine kinase modulator